MVLSLEARFGRTLHASATIALRSSLLIYFESQNFKLMNFKMNRLIGGERVEIFS